MPRKPAAEEFFYNDDDGRMADEMFHHGIMMPVDYPELFAMDERRMAPIRAKNRAKHNAKRKRFKDASLYAEGEHPRGKGGKWTEKGGGDAPPPHDVKRSNASALFEAPPKPAPEMAREIVAKVPGAEAEIARVKEKLSKVKNTNWLVKDGGHKLEDGTYTPARAAEHQRILREFINEQNVKQFSPAPGENPVLTLLGGRGGSGKSWLSGKDGPVDASTSLVIDSDAVKAMLPEYDGWNAAQLHEESCDIVAMIDHAAAKLGLNVVLDGTMSSVTLQDRIDAYQAPEDSVYELEGYYMYASPVTAATRAMERWAKGGTFEGRLVPPEIILGNVNNEKNFDRLSDDFRKWAIYDNDGEGFDPRLVDQHDGIRGRKGRSDT
jgi:hypothetical protein